MEMTGIFGVSVSFPYFSILFRPFVKESQVVSDAGARPSISCIMEGRALTLFGKLWRCNASARA